MKNRKKAFTLVELLVVIAILGILATVAIVGYTSYMEKANQASYLQTAEGNLKRLRLETNDKIEEETYIFINKNNKNVGWFEYLNGKIVQFDSEPELSADYLYSMDNSYYSFLSENVVVYRPVCMDVAQILNDGLISASATNYEELLEASKSLSDFNIEVMNNRANDYKYAYTLATNEVIIVNGDMNELLYSEKGLTSVPNDLRTIVGSNLYSAQDLIDFSNTTNLNSSTIPTASNIYVYGSPIVLANLKKDIDLGDRYAEYHPMAHWYAYSGNYNTICLNLNGNSHKISGLNRSFVGALGMGSNIKDLELSYTIGTSTTPDPMPDYDSSAVTSYNMESKTGFWHFGMLAQCLKSTSSTCSSQDVININGLVMSGKVYFSNGGLASRCGLMFGGIYNHENKCTNTFLSITNSEIFSGEDDVVGFTALQGYGVVCGNYTTGAGTSLSDVKGIEFDNTNSFLNITYKTTQLYGLLENN